MRSLLATSGALLAVATVLAMSFLYGLIGPPARGPGPSLVAPREVPPKPAAAPAGPFEILIVGTSLTSRGDWPNAIQAELSICAPDGVTLTRLAAAGKGIRWGLPALKAYLEDEQHAPPDVVVVEFSGNDATLRAGLPLFLARSRTREAIELIRSTGAIPFLSTMSPAWGWEWAPRPGLARYHGAYRDLAAETGAGLVDTAPVWLALPEDERKRLVPDGGHPTDEGMERIAVPAIVSALRPFACN